MLPGRTTLSNGLVHVQFSATAQRGSDLSRIKIPEHQSLWYPTDQYTQTSEITTEFGRSPDEGLTQIQRSLAIVLPCTDTHVMHQNNQNFTGQRLPLSPERLKGAKDQPANRG